MTPRFRLSEATPADFARVSGYFRKSAKPDTPRDMERLLQSFGFSRREAQKLMAGGYKELDPDVSPDAENTDMLAAIADGLRRVWAAYKGESDE